MSRTFTNAGLFGLTTTTGITAVPLSIFCRFLPTNAGASQLCGIWNGASDTFDAFYLETTASSASVRAVTAAGSLFSLATSSAGFSINVWNTSLAVFTSATSRDVYLNGTNKGSDTISRTPSSLSRIAVAITGKLTGSGAMIGDLADITFWNAALTEEEGLAMHLGVNPRHVRPSNVIDDFPLWGLSSPEPNFGTPARTLALTGSPAKNNHGPATLWTPKWAAAAPLIEAAGGAVTSPYYAYAQQ